MKPIDKAIGIASLVIALAIMAFAWWGWYRKCADAGGYLIRGRCVQEISI